MNFMNHEYFCDYLSDIYGIEITVALLVHSMLSEFNFSLTNKSDQTRFGTAQLEFNIWDFLKISYKDIIFIFHAILRIFVSYDYRSTAKEDGKIVCNASR